MSMSAIDQKSIGIFIMGASVFSALMALFALALAIKVANKKRQYEKAVGWDRLDEWQKKQRLLKLVECAFSDVNKQHLFGEFNERSGKNIILQEAMHEHALRFSKEANIPYDTALKVLRKGYAEQRQSF